MKIVLEIEEGQRVEIEQAWEGNGLHDVIELLIEPALLALGYHQHGIDAEFGRESSD